MEQCITTFLPVKYAILLESGNLKHNTFDEKENRL